MRIPKSILLLILLLKPNLTSETDRIYYISKTSSKEINEKIKKSNSIGKLTISKESLGLSGYCNGCGSGLEKENQGFVCTEIWCENTYDIERFVINILQKNEFKFIENLTDFDASNAIYMTIQGENGDNWIEISKKKALNVDNLGNEENKNFEFFVKGLSNKSLNDELKSEFTKKGKIYIKEEGKKIEIKGFCNECFTEKKDDGVYKSFICTAMACEFGLGVEQFLLQVAEENKFGFVDDAKNGKKEFRIEGGGGKWADVSVKFLGLFSIGLFLANLGIILI